MIPQFLQTVLGYTAELAGLVLSIGAIVLLIEMPIVGQLTSKVPARYLIAFGWLAVALSMVYTTTHFGLFLDFWTATRIRTAQVVGLGFLFVPITLVSYVGLPQEKSNMVSGLINFMRNIGSSVGTSMVTTLIARRAQYHQTVLIDNLTPGSPTFLNGVGGLTNSLTHGGFSLQDAQARAHADAVWVRAAAGRDAGLHRHVLGSRRHRRDHVWSLVPAEEERARPGRGQPAEWQRMKVRVVTIEREFGSGGADIAKRLAERLGWKLWDQRLTDEIARLAQCDQVAGLRSAKSGWIRSTTACSNRSCAAALKEA